MKYKCEAWTKVRVIDNCMDLRKIMREYIPTLDLNLPLSKARLKYGLIYNTPESAIQVLVCPSYKTISNEEYL